MLQDVGYDSGDESKVSIIGFQDKDKDMSLSHHVNTSESIHSYSTQDDKKQGEIFHVRFITKHTKVDMLFDSGSQVNLVSEEVGKKLG